MFQNARGSRKVMMVMSVALPFLAGGCFVSVPLLVGAGAGVGGYAWYKGYLKKQYNVDVATAVRATERALKDLGFIVDASKFDKFGARIKGERGTGQAFVIEMARAGEGRTTVNIRVGIPGDQELAREVHTAIQKHL